MKYKVKASTMIETVVIRTEQLCDFDEIRTVVKTAFARAEHTDGDEHNLVDRLRCTEEYIPELSFVAEIKGKIVGYAMFSQINIGMSKAIALAPLAVLPDFQNQGIGRALIEAGHLKAKEGDYYCSVVLGSPEYYSKSGYLSALPFGIEAPFEVPTQFYMVFPFKRKLPHGTVRYSQAFGI